MQYMSLEDFLEMVQEISSTLFSLLFFGVSCVLLNDSSYERSLEWLLNIMGRTTKTRSTGRCTPCVINKWGGGKGARECV